MPMSMRLTPNLTAGKQQSVLVYIIPHVFSPKDSSTFSARVGWDCVYISSQNKVQTLLRPYGPHFHFGMFFPPAELAAPQEHIYIMCTGEVMHGHKHLLSDLNERHARQRNRWLFINAACVNLRHSSSHLLPAALSSSTINPWQLPRTCHSSSSTFSEQQPDNNTNKKQKSAHALEATGIRTKKAVDEAQREEKRADDGRNDLMLDIDLESAYVQLSWACVGVLCGMEGAGCHIGRLTLGVLRGCWAGWESALFNDKGKLRRPACGVQGGTRLLNEAPHTFLLCTCNREEWLQLPSFQHKIKCVHQVRRKQKENCPICLKSRKKNMFRNFSFYSMWENAERMWLFPHEQSLFQETEDPLWLRHLCFLVFMSEGRIQWGKWPGGAVPSSNHLLFRTCG